MSQHLFIICNPSSGGKQAGKLLRYGPINDFKVDKREIVVHFHDINNGESGQKPAFVLMKEIMKLESQYQHNFLKVAVAGGDGTVLWVVSELEAHGINPDRVALGVIPLGTGNDFSRSTGFGGGVTNIHFSLKSIISELVRAYVHPFDLWNVRVKAHNDGAIYSIKNGVKTPLQDEFGNNETEVNKLSCNYFSIGIESRIGLGFDKHRTKSQIGNKMIYGMESVKKMFLRMPKVRNTIKRITIGHNHDTTSSSSYSNIVKPDDFACDPLSLVFQNVPSIAAGCDMWSLATSNTLKGEYVKNANLINLKQDFGDERLEIMTVNGIPSFGMAKIGIKGVAKRLEQTRGPCKIDFNETIGVKERTYFQVDGEYFAIHKPQSASISHKRRIFVLVASHMKQYHSNQIRSSSGHIVSSSISLPRQSLVIRKLTNADDDSETSLPIVEATTTCVKKIPLSCAEINISKSKKNIWSQTSYILTDLGFYVVLAVTALILFICFEYVGNDVGS
jgi:diacylglycerol kinase (ATP)